MFLFLILLAFLVSPGVMAALLSRKVVLRKAVSVSYKEVLVATVVFGILYTVLKRVGLVREGFQYRSGSEQPAPDYMEKSCEGPTGTKCKLASKGSSKERYGECIMNSNKSGFTCINSLDRYNATNWTEGKLIAREQQPGYAEAVESEKRIAADSARSAAQTAANIAKKGAETRAKMMIDLNTPTVRNILKNEFNSMKRQRTYNPTINRNIQNFRSLLIPKINNLTGNTRKDYNTVMNALLLLKDPDDQAYFNQYLDAL